MSKSSGLGAGFLVSGYDLSGDVGSLSRIGGGPAALEVTGINKLAPERLGGKRDGSMDFQTWFNPSAAQAHPVLAALPRTNVLATYAHRQTIGSSAACCIAKQVGYDGTRAEDGSLSFGVSVQANRYGLEWGRLATGFPRTDTTATNGASIDLGAASSFGLQAYLHVLAFTGTSFTATLQGSSDNGAGDAFAAITGGAFAAANTARTFQRIQTARNQAIERYLRVVTTGTFSSAVFVVVVSVNPVAVNF